MTGSMRTLRTPVAMTLALVAALLPAPARAATAEAERGARAHFQAGEARFKAGAYDEALAEVPGLILPSPVPYSARHSWHIYTPLLDLEVAAMSRDDFLLALKAENIGTGLHYTAVHLHPYYRDTWGFRRGDFPHAEYVSDRIFSLPLFPRLTADDQADVVDALRRLLG